jgi:cephalosporin hydroxylase
MNEFKTDKDILLEIINISTEDTQGKYIPSSSFFSNICQFFLKIMNKHNCKYMSDITKFVSKEHIEVYNNVCESIQIYSKGRYVDYFKRVSLTDGKCSYNAYYSNKITYLRESTFIDWCATQGKCHGSIIYKTLELYKTSYDFAIYPIILQEIKPKTIIELGSGNGSSAIWMNDICKIHNLDTQILSLEIHDIKPRLQNKNINLDDYRINFIKGDAYKIEEYFPPSLLQSLPHPWIIIEDCHHNTYNIMKYLDKFLEKSDYLIIEDPDEVDTSNKTKEGLSIMLFMKEHHNDYVVDTRYCDYFGKNNCSFPDSIFKYIGS